MPKKTNNYTDCINTLTKLKKLYPTYTLGQHFATALADYPDTWGISDKELLFALSKYATEMECNTIGDMDLDRIIEDGKNLDKLFSKEDPYEDEEDGYD